MNAPAQLLPTVAVFADPSLGPAIEDSAYYFPASLFAEGHRLKVKPLFIKEAGSAHRVLCEFKRNKRIQDDSFDMLGARFFVQTMHHEDISYGIFVHPHYPEPVIGEVVKATAVINNLTFKTTRDTIVVEGTYVGPCVNGLWLVPIFKGENMKINELSYFLLCRSPQVNRKVK